MPADGLWYYQTPAQLSVCRETSKRNKIDEWSFLPHVVNETNPESRNIWVVPKEGVEPSPGLSRTGF